MKKKMIAVIIACLAAMFAWIFLAVALTGGREIDEMTPQDMKVMWGMVAAEVLTIGALCAALVKFNRGMAQQKLSPAQPQPQQKLSPAESARFARGSLICISSAVLSVGAGAVGVRLHGQIGAPAWAGAVRVGCYVLGVLLPLCSWGGSRLCIRHYQAMNVAQGQTLVLSLREQAERTARAKLKKLRVIRCVSGGYAGLLLLLGLTLGVSSGLAENDVNVVPVICAAILIQFFFQQIPFPEPKAVLSEISNRLPEAEYSRLYALAGKAARESGWTEDVCLTVSPVCGASIGIVRDTAVVTLGAPALRLLTQEELSMLLLHEFAHVGAGEQEELRQTRYMNFLHRGRNPNVLSAVNDACYALPDFLYSMEFELYQYAAALPAEQRADAAMSRNPAAAAAGLLKLKYYDLFLWENEACDRKPEYESEPTHVVSEQVQRFLDALPQRRTQWNRIVQGEILARNASHPTTWGRIQALGLKALPDADALPTGEYGAECRRALEYTDSQIAAYYAPRFEELHRENYTEPLERVNQWIASGSPLTAEGYADIVEDLCLLGRGSEAIALCDRAVRELTPIAAAFAYFTRGCWRLHRYNAEGLEDLYTAISLSGNFADEALEEIGSFCCLAGMQEELDTYREKALEVAQKQRDEYSQIGTLSRRDKLSQEHLPDGMQEQILGFLWGSFRNAIDRVYLVRKTVSNTFFTSAFVIRFRAGTPEEVREQVLHKIFRYLDTCSDWQFSLFDYDDVPKGTVEQVPGSCVCQWEE